MKALTTMTEVNTEFKGVNYDDTLDAIDDLPGFVTLPTGAYLLEMPEGMVDKAEDMKKPSIGVKFKLLEILELTEDNLLPAKGEEGTATYEEAEKPPMVGSIADTLFMMDNPVGADSFKKFAVPIMAHIAEHNGGTKPTIREMWVLSKNMKVIVVMKRTYSSVKDRYYSNVKKVMVA